MHNTSIKIGNNTPEFVSILGQIADAIVAQDVQTFEQMYAENIQKMADTRWFNQEILAAAFVNDDSNLKFVSKIVANIMSPNDQLTKRHNLYIHILRLVTTSHIINDITRRVNALAAQPPPLTDEKKEWFRKTLWNKALTNVALLVYQSPYYIDDRTWDECTIVSSWRLSSEPISDDAILPLLAAGFKAVWRPRDTRQDLRDKLRNYASAYIQYNVEVAIMLNQRVPLEVACHICSFIPYDAKQYKPPYPELKPINNPLSVEHHPIITQFGEAAIHSMLITQAACHLYSDEKYSKLRLWEHVSCTVLGEWQVIYQIAQFTVNTKKMVQLQHDATFVAQRVAIRWQKQAEAKSNMGALEHAMKNHSIPDLFSSVISVLTNIVDQVNLSSGLTAQSLAFSLHKAFMAYEGGKNIVITITPEVHAKIVAAFSRHEPSIMYSEEVVRTIVDDALNMKR